MAQANWAAGASAQSLYLSLFGQCLGSAISKASFGVLDLRNLKDFINHLTLKSKGVNPVTF